VRIRLKIIKSIYGIDLYTLLVPISKMERSNRVEKTKKNKQKNGRVRKSTGSSKSTKSTKNPNPLAEQLSTISSSKKRIKVKKQRAEKAVIQKEKRHFNFKRHKTTGTYAIYGSNGDRMSIFAKDVFLPFGIETYNNKSILNVSIKILDNFHHNTIVWLREFDERMEALAGKDSYRFDLDGYEYQPVLKENHYVNKDGEDDMRYMIRTHLNNGVKITHRSFFGNYDRNNLPKKRCNMTMFIGSLWINEDDKKYGCTIYIPEIKVLN